jgi:dTDP-4-dehydrorhamnose 3,5-epimerase-like enzyme
MLFKGGRFEDQRGVVTFNNEWDISAVKRIYTVENRDTAFVRGWQGHKIERRWFCCMKGRFEIAVVKVDNFEAPNPSLPIDKYILTDQEMSYLSVPPGCMTAIKALDLNSKLLVMSDFRLGEVQDEYRLPCDYFQLG